MAVQSEYLGALNLQIAGQLSNLLPCKQTEENITKLKDLKSSVYPDTGYRIPDTGYRIPDTGYRIVNTGYRISLTFGCNYSSSDVAQCQYKILQLQAGK